MPTTQIVPAENGPQTFKSSSHLYIQVRKLNFNLMSLVSSSVFQMATFMNSTSLHYIVKQNTPLNLILFLPNLSAVSGYSQVYQPRHMCNWICRPTFKKGTWF